MTSAPAINTIADLYRIIDEQPEWGAALRNRLLGRLTGENCPAVNCCLSPGSCPIICLQGAESP